MGIQSSLRVFSPSSSSLFIPGDSASCSCPPSPRTLLAFRRSPRFHLKVLSQQQPQPSADSNSKITDGSASADRFSHNKMVAEFMRFKHRSNSDDLLAELQTAIISYRKNFPWSFLQPFLQVDLVSTIHIADKEYFAALQRELEHYDCVLYEMVASRDSLESRGSLFVKKSHKSLKDKGFNIIGFIQRQMARLLMLDFQLDCLDYQSKNWYHADLDFETFELLQDEKGESFFSFASDMTARSTKSIVQSASISVGVGKWRSKLLWASRVLPMPLIGLVIIEGLCADMLKQASQYPELEALSRLDFVAAMKLFLAKRLTSGLTHAISDVEAKSVLIGERNKAATKILRNAIHEGHNKIAILYGGGHVPDLGRRLREEFDLFPSQVRWVTAWSIGAPNVPDSSLPFLVTLGWPLNRFQTVALFLFSSVLAFDLCLWELFFGTTFDLFKHVVADIFS